MLTRTVGGRKFGVNELPARVRVTSLAALTGFLGTSDERRRHTRMLAQASGYPLLWEWVAAKPGRALRHGDEFGDLVTALTWIAANAGSGRQLREVDAPGIDTKFIESHRTVLLELGPLVVAPISSTPLRSRSPGVSDSPPSRSHSPALSIRTSPHRCLVSMMWRCGSPTWPGCRWTWTAW